MATVETEESEMATPAAVRFRAKLDIQLLPITPATVNSFRMNAPSLYTANIDGLCLFVGPCWLFCRV
jgi:hypothetical protein